MHEYARARRDEYRYLDRIRSRRFANALALTSASLGLLAGVPVAIAAGAPDLFFTAVPWMEMVLLVGVVRVWRAPKSEAPALLTEHGMTCTIRLSDRGVACTNGVQVSECSWEDVRLVHESGEFLLFRMADGETAHLPKRVMAHPQLLRARTLILDRMGQRARLQPYDPWKA